MATHAPFLNHIRLPVFRFLSPDSFQALEEYLAAGNRSHREALLLEFFRSIDWLAFDEIRALPGSPLRKLSAPQQRRLLQEIEQYFHHKRQQRQERSEKRKSHRLQVFEYFRHKVSANDKQLLERLRDYELDQTGRDQNWQHYFALKSFKQVDAFVAMSVAERQERIAAFKRDVQTFKKNAERNRDRQQSSFDKSPFTFDDWCEAFQWTSFEDLFGQRQQHRHEHHDPSGNRSRRKSGFFFKEDQLQQDYACLGLPPETPLAEVKKRFRNLTLTHHPDVPGGSAQKMKTLLAAYERLKAHLGA